MTAKKVTMSTTGQEPLIYSRYSPSPKRGYTFKEPSRTQQHFADECDINQIVARCIKTRTPLPYREDGIYGDFTAIDDYATAIDAIGEANSNFEMLPASIRDRFKNDPAQFLRFVDNPANLQEMINLGLVSAPKATLPDPGGGGATHASADTSQASTIIPTNS